MAGTTASARVTHTLADRLIALLGEAVGTMSQEHSPAIVPRLRAAAWRAVELTVVRNVALREMQLVWPGRA